MNRPTDDELVARFVGGDRSAFNEIVDRHEQRVFAVALRMCGNRDDALDVVQDVFVAALGALASWRAEAQLSTWLHRIAVNSSLDLLRRRRRRAASPIDEAADRPAPGPAPEDEAAQSERAAAVRRALAALTPDQRAAIVLHDLEGLDYAEVAEALGAPLGTVKSRIHRARLALAGLLGHLREDQPDAPGREPEAAGRLLTDGDPG